MKRQKTPQEKKAISYEKDRMYLAENRAAFFKNFPRIKARAVRKERRQVREILATARLSEEGTQGDIPLRPVMRDRVRKHCGPVPLGMAIERLHGQRDERTGWKFFRMEYQSEAHREAFAAFLTSLTAGTSDESARLARLFSEILDPPAGHHVWSPADQYNLRRHSWLEAFFEDEPQWEPRLRAWVERLVGVED
jgi:hypothetical protein